MLIRTPAISEMVRPIWENIFPCIGYLLPSAPPISVQSDRLNPIGIVIRPEWSVLKIDIAERCDTLIQPAIIDKISKTRKSIAIIAIPGTPSARY
jgi:hypothetical protein